MIHDLFALWDANEIPPMAISDVHQKIKYLLTRDEQERRRTYHALLQNYSPFDMSLYSASLDAVSIMPRFSSLLTFSFVLATPYLSRDDEEFYICDNPIRKDKVFKVPMVSGSTWKGNMRWTAMKLFTDKLPGTINDADIDKIFELRGQLVRLFGHEKERIEDYLNEVLAAKLPGGCTKKNKEELKKKFNKFLQQKDYIHEGVEGRRGRLNFYPTFFDKIGLEVINPHDRKTKAGTLPIYIESVPEGATGTFSLLYVPFDLVGRPEHDAKQEVTDDIDLIYESLKEMMLTYGFSAKKSSGFGIVEEKINGTFDLSGRPDIAASNLTKNAFSSFDQLGHVIERARITVAGGDKR